MKQISYEKELNKVALLKKQMSNREIANVVGLSQSKVNKIRKKHFENIIMPRKGQWKKQYATHLVIVGGLDIALEATSKLKNTLGCDV